MRRDGFAVIEGFLDADEVAALSSDLGQALRRPAGPSCKRPHNTLVPLRWSDPPVARVLASARRMERLRETVAADDLRWISGYFGIKEPRSPALWWHQDWWCWEHPVTERPEAAQIAVLCYLDAVDEENAALRVLPGSHRSLTALHDLLPEAHGAEADGLPEVPGPPGRRRARSRGIAGRAPAPALRRPARRPAAEPGAAAPLHFPNIRAVMPARSPRLGR